MTRTLSWLGGAASSPRNDTEKVVRGLRILARARLRVALVDLRARCWARAVYIERSKAVAAVARAEAAAFELAEARNFLNMTRDDLSECESRAGLEIRAAWSQADASDSGHAAQAAAFAALFAENARLRAALDRSASRCAELRLQRLEVQRTSHSQRDLEVMLIDAKVELALLKATPWWQSPSQAGDQIIGRLAPAN